MRQLAYAVCALLLLGPGLRGQSAQFGVDKRVELMSIVFRLAGNMEYSQGRIPAYNAAIDRYFAPFRDHEAIRIARGLRESDKVGFDAVMSIAVHIKDAELLAERVPLDHDSSLDARWHAETARRFLNAVRKFVVDSNFAGFVESQRPFYDQVDARLRSFVAENADLGWFDRFFGPRSHSPFHLVPGLVNGGPSYGPHVTLADGSEEIYAIPGVWKVDADGLPVFDAAWTQTLVHEFSHSYANPLIDKFAPQLQQSGEALFQVFGAQMRRQAYRNGRTVLYESLVRAVTARYEFEHHGAEAAARVVNEERRNSFLWTGALLALLDQYANNREHYPTLESFMPQVVAFFGDVSSKAPSAYDENRPKVVSMNINDSASDVDPGLKEIVIRFSRPMMRNNYAICDIPEAPEPKESKASFDESGQVFTVTVTLEPDKEYGFSLNEPGLDVFQSVEGIPLSPVKVRFRTRAARTVPPPAKPVAH